MEEIESKLEMLDDGQIDFLVKELITRDQGDEVLNVFGKEINRAGKIKLLLKDAGALGKYLERM